MVETYVTDTGEAWRRRDYSVVVGNRYNNDTIAKDCDVLDDIQYAVDMASQKGGGTVIVRSGPYNTPHTRMPITVPANVIVRGEGSGTVISQRLNTKVFILNGGALQNLMIDATLGGAANPVDMSGTDVSMTDVIITGGTSVDVVRVLDCVRGSIVGGSIFNCAGIAINVVPPLSLRTFTIEDVVIDLVGLGIRVSGNVARMSIEGCDISLATTHGIHIVQGDRINISENVCTLNGGDGIRVDTANNNVMNNESNQNGGFGINMTATSTRNVCSTNIVRANVAGFIQDLSNPGTNEVVHYQL